MTFRACLGLIATGAAALTGCGPQQAEVRYRVTVDVMENGIVRSGSGVWSFTLTRGMAGGYDPRIRGEAIVVDLGARGRLFALLAGRSRDGSPTSYDDMGLLPEALFGDVGRGRAGKLPLYDNRIEDLRAIKSQVGTSKSLPCFVQRKYADDCPFMVRFDNLADVTSIQPVDPNDLAQTFGPGVALKSVTVEITDDPVGLTDDETLPDYRNSRGFFQWYATLPIDDPRRVGPENFLQNGMGAASVGYSPDVLLNYALPGPVARILRQGVKG